MKTRQIDWSNSAFLILSPIITLALLFSGWVTFHWGLIWFAFVLMCISSISITGGYHRLFAHKSYEAHPLLRLFYLVFGAAAAENSALKWCHDHRRHHREVDQEGDPYNIQKGFFHAHMGWILFKDHPKYARIKHHDLCNDPLIQWQHKYYIWIAIGVGGVFPAAVGAYFYGDWLSGFVIGGLLRTVLMHHSAFLVNSACHYWGKQTYSNASSARDSSILAFFTYGEGYHNFHHAFEWDYRNGVRFYHWDPTKWFIQLSAQLGLAKGLKRVVPGELLKARLNMQKLSLEGIGRWSEQLATLKTKVEAAQDRMRKLAEEYRQDRDVRNQKLAAEIRQAKREFRRLYSQWKMEFSMAQA